MRRSAVLTSNEASTPSLKRSVLPCVRSGARCPPRSSRPKVAVVADQPQRRQLAGGDRGSGRKQPMLLPGSDAGQHVEPPLVHSPASRETELGLAPRGDGMGGDGGSMPVSSIWSMLRST
jgi:hypothetical protein